VCVLAPAKKPTKFEKQMAATLEDLAKQFEGFQSMMKQTLDELSDLKTWRGCTTARTPSIGSSDSSFR